MDNLQLKLMDFKVIQDLKVERQLLLDSQQMMEILKLAHTWVGLFMPLVRLEVRRAEPNSLQVELIFLELGIFQQEMSQSVEQDFRLIHSWFLLQAVPTLLENTHLAV